MESGFNGCTGGAELLCIFFIMIVSVLGAILTIIPFWKICSKAGFPGPLSLLMLVPIANIVLPFYIAFAQWPVLKDKLQ
jgi:hypothetical protein